MTVCSQSVETATVSRTGREVAWTGFSEKERHFYERENVRCLGFRSFLNELLQISPPGGINRTILYFGEVVSLWIFEDTD